MNTKVIDTGENFIWDKFKELVELKNNNKYVLEYKQSRFETVIKKGWDKQLRRVNIEQQVYRERGLVFAQ